MTPVAGCLFVIAAPSGGGKTSIVNALLAREPGIRLSVSYTTRAPRPGEHEGVHYHFVDKTRFDELREAVARSKYLTLTPPRGALYAFVGVDTQRLPGFDDRRFAMDLLEHRAPGGSRSRAAARAAAAPAPGSGSRPIR